jgi:hypothetical protein
MHFPETDLKTGLWYLFGHPRMGEDTLQCDSFFCWDKHPRDQIFGLGADSVELGG